MDQAYKQNQDQQPATEIFFCTWEGNSCSRNKAQILGIQTLFLHPVTGVAFHALSGAAYFLWHAVLLLCLFNDSPGHLTTTWSARVVQSGQVSISFNDCFTQKLRFWPQLWLQARTTYNCQFCESTKQRVLGDRRVLKHAH